MNYVFDDYKIQILDSTNYPNKFVAFIEEFHNVISIIENKADAAEKLKPLFEKEINRLISSGQIIPKPGTGKAKIVFAANEKIENLKPFVEEFWEKIFETSYSTSFVSNSSRLRDWEHYVPNGKLGIIEKVKQVYSIDISPMYDQPVWEILTVLKNKVTFL